MKSGGIFKIGTQIEESPSAILSLAFAALLAFPFGADARVSQKVVEICAKTTDAAYRAKYCSAAKDLKHGHNANVATSAVWTGVSVACGMACGKTYNGSGMACQVAGYGGTAGEGVITKKFTDALMGEGMKWGGQAAAKGAGTTTVATTDSGVAAAGGKVNADACASAGKSALKAYEKFSNSKENDKSLTKLREETKGMNTPVAKNQVSYTAGSDDSGDGPTESAATSRAATCGDAAIGTALGAIRCAASADPSLPPYVKSEEFLKDLQKATGKSPDAFFAAFESPAKSIFDSPVAAGLSEGQQNSLADSLSAMEGYSDSKAKKLAAQSPASSAGGYAAKGGAPGSAGEDDDTGFDMNGMIAGVLGQMGGEDDGKNGAAANAGGMANVERRPAGNAEAAEDPSISIFDRVQFRYGSVSARDRLGVQ